MAHLIVQADGKTVYHKLVDPVTTIGRAAECTIRLNDQKASRTHCRVEECDRGYKLIDLGSANGTLINGEPVDHRILRAGDVIEIGAVVMTYEVETKDVLRIRRLSKRHRSHRARSTRLRGTRRLSREAEQNGGRAEASAAPPEAPAAGADPDETQEVAEASLLPPLTSASSPAAELDQVDPANRAELAMAVRRLLNDLIERHGEDGLVEMEKIQSDYLSDESAVEPRVQHLIEDRDMMASVLEISRAINSNLHFEKLLDQIIDETIEFTSAERGFVILLDEEEDETEAHEEYTTATVVAARSFGKETISNPDEKFSKVIVREVIENGRPLLSTNAHEEGRFHESESVVTQRLLSVLCVPLRSRERIIGVLYIDNRFETGVFTERDLLWLDSVADLAGVAIENARQARHLEDALTEVRAKARQIEELNALLEQRLENREAELAEAKAQLVRRAEGREEPRTVDGYRPRFEYPQIVGSSPAMRPVFQWLDKAAVNDSIRVLIEGENGTGKELAARALHEHSPRKDGPFVAENCGAVPETLFESIFFGYAKGAFTGATKDTAGLFEQANGGTLFLDEVGEIPSEQQAALLRVLETGQVRRIGDSKERDVDVRIISATNRDLEQMVNEKQFREDLYYRLNGIAFHLPALRERREDIRPLAENFFAEAFEEFKTAPKPVDDDVYDLLCNFDWPGNVRQLRNTCRNVVMFGSDQAKLTLECVPPELREQAAAGASGRQGGGAHGGKGTDGLPEVPPGTPLKQAVKMVSEALEARMIEQVFRECNWVKKDAAERLGISRPTLDAKLEAYGIKAEKS